MIRRSLCDYVVVVTALLVLKRCLVNIDCTATTTTTATLCKRTSFIVVNDRNRCSKYYQSRRPNFSNVLLQRRNISPNDDNSGVPVDHLTRLAEESSKEATVPRRKIFFSGSLLLANTLLPIEKVNAITMEYPLELRAPTNIDDVRNADNRRIRKVNEINQQQFEQREQLTSNHILGSVVWGIALWVLSGSRSNPITTPLANIIYDVEQETWLQDRNDGLFANLPWEYFIILGVVFSVIGYGTDQFVNAIADGDATISLQLASVTLIGGASLELGRISSGVKKPTRTESDRSNQLEIEFIDFASSRLQTGGNCHRNEVVQAFRRYYSKYRQADNPDYPLSDLEIEQLLRSFCRNKGLEMSPAGFYSGIQINSNADAFVKK